MRTLAAALLAAALLYPATAAAGPPTADEPAGAAIVAGYQAALRACGAEVAGETPGRRMDRVQACEAAEHTRMFDLQAAAADLAHYYAPGWAEGARDDELAAASEHVASLLALARADAAHWGVVAPAGADPGAPIAAMVAKERACRAAPKCVADRAAARAEAAAEAAFFTSVVNPMCTAEQDKEGAAADMRREHANPSGLYDKRRVYADGATIQSADEMLAGYTPAYVARRHHPWRGWRAECKPNPAYYDR